MPGIILEIYMTDRWLSLYIHIASKDKDTAHAWGRHWQSTRRNHRLGCTRSWKPSVNSSASSVQARHARRRRQSTCHYHISLSHVIIICHYHISLSHVIITCHYHMSLSHVIITGHYHISLSHVIITCHYHRSLSHVIITGHYHISLWHQQCTTFVISCWIVK